MHILGIDFIPISEPLHRRLETLATAAWFFLVTAAGYICLLFSIYLLFTPFWWIILLYALWIYFDRDTCETGGRPNKWVQSWTWWLYTKNYFSPRLQISPNFTPDLKTNYLFCCFPHGVIPAGPYCNIACPSITFFVTYNQGTLFSNRRISCTAKSLCYTMTKPEGGHIAILFPGGAAEAMHAQPELYKFVVKNRKGFVRVALKTGAPLVPVITFGEPDVFNQLRGPMIRKIQNIVKKWFGFAPVFCIGSGFLQRSFGFIPRRTVLTTVVGKPVQVPRRDEPTNEEIDRIHAIFVDELVKLFDMYKYEFLENPDENHLVLE